MEEKQAETSITINKSEIKEKFGKYISFFRKKIVVSALIAIFLVLMIFISSSIRTSNIEELKDVTTDQYTLGPDLDPFLYLRVAEEIINYGSPLNPDYMRYHGAKPYYNFLPYGIAYLYKFLSLFTEISLEYAAIIFPVIFFGASIIVFFFLIRKIFDDRSEMQKNLIAMFSTALYVVMPLMLPRTVAGIPELESAGLFFFWLSFLFFVHAWDEKNQDSNSQISKFLNKRNVFSVLSGIFTGAMIFTWGGVKFIFMAIPLSILISFIFGKVGKKETIMYALWFIPSIFFLILKSGWEILSEITTFPPSSFVFLVLMVNLFIGKNFEEKIRRFLKKEWISKEIISLLITIVIPLAIFLVLKPSSLFNFFYNLKELLLYPFGRARVSLTVAENAQPYVTTWLSNFGKSFFWLFFFGTLFLFNDSISKLDKKTKIILNFSFILFILGFIFSRYSPNSIFNGENFVSQLVYFGVLFIFIFSLGHIYIKKSKGGMIKELSEIKISHIFVICLIILMIIASRGAVRLFVISSPVFIIATGFLPVALLNYWKKSKDDLLKILLFLALLISVFYLASTFVNYYQSTSETAKITIPSSYNIQWQNAMSWVRKNTPENSVFVHWWDYGYWIQTIGKRPTVTDGGHENTYWDHLIGRYVLTTPYPETALSFMKTHNVSYLLIDPTDIGKYGAYAKIGSDENTDDRYSYIPVLISDSSNVLETRNGKARLYQGGVGLDEDIIYEKDQEKIFLPAGKAFLAGIILEYSEKEDSVRFNQPKGVFVYNQKQYEIPIRYFYYNTQMIDFKEGVESAIHVIPGAAQNKDGTLNLDNLMAAIYLSKRTFNSLVGQLYVLNDAFNKYPSLELVHSQHDPYIEFILSQGANLTDFFYLNGLRGPIKIWKFNAPDNIIEHKEFLETSGGYARLDNFTFTK